MGKLLKLLVTNLLLRSSSIFDIFFKYYNGSTTHNHTDTEIAINY